MSENPYAPPTAPAAGSSFNLGAPTSAAVRQIHLKHEASVKSIGTLYFLGGLLLLGVSLVPFLLPDRAPDALTLQVSAFIALYQVEFQKSRMPE